MFENKRLLSEPEACEYIGVKRNKLREFAKSCGAVRHIGSRVLYDKVVIDRVIDEASPDEVLCGNSNAAVVR